MDSGNLGKMLTTVSKGNRNRGIVINHGKKVSTSNVAPLVTSVDLVNSDNNVNITNEVAIKVDKCQFQVPVVFCPTLDKFELSPTILGMTHIIKSH